MQIVALATGTRGDVQPMIALGQALRRRGHRVRVVAGANFARWIAEHGLDVYATIDTAELMGSEAGIRWVESAGTTAAGLRAGKPALIVPHMADQPFWGRRVHQLGVGVKPIPRPRLTAERLAHQLHTLIGDTRIAANVSALGERIRAEQGVETAVEWIEQYVSRPFKIA